jgi:hypothetical protein
MSLLDIDQPVNAPPPTRKVHVIFRDAARDLAKVGIATIPIRINGKGAAVGGWGDDGARYTVNTSLKHAGNPTFAACNVAILCGKRSGISVIDIDTKDEGQRELDLQWVLSTLGETPVIARTGNGGYHVLYRHAGEGRFIKPFPGRAIDVLGSRGYFVAPPSIHPETGQPYRFIRGGIDDLGSLPVMDQSALADLLEECEARKIAEKTELEELREEPISLDHVEGNQPSGDKASRNKALFDYACEVAWEVGSLSELQDRVRLKNTEGSPEDEVLSTAKSAWRYRQEGKLFRRGAPKPTIDWPIFRTLLASGDTDAIALFNLLIFAHSGREEAFAISPQSLQRAGHIGRWAKERYRRATETLLELGAVERVHRGGRYIGDASLFRFATGDRQWSEVK